VKDGEVFIKELGKHSGMTKYSRKKKGNEGEKGRQGPPMVVPIQNPPRPQKEE